MRQILLQSIHVHRKMLLWCPPFHAFCSLPGSVETQWKISEKHKIE